jgi:hypothetical protein
MRLSAWRWGFPEAPSRFPVSPEFSRFLSGRHRGQAGGNLLKQGLQFGLLFPCPLAMLEIMFVMAGLASHFFDFSRHHAHNIMVHEETTPFTVVVYKVTKTQLLVRHGKVPLLKRVVPSAFCNWIAANNKRILQRRNGRGSILP